MKCEELRRDVNKAVSSSEAPSEDFDRDSGNAEDDDKDMSLPHECSTCLQNFRSLRQLR